MTSVPSTYGCLAFPVTGLTEFVPAPLLVLSQILVLSRLPVLSDGTPAPPGVGRTGAADTEASLLRVLGAMTSNKLPGVMLLVTLCVCGCRQVHMLEWLCGHFESSICKTPPTHMPCFGAMHLLPSTMDGHSATCMFDAVAPTPIHENRFVVVLLHWWLLHLSLVCSP